MPESKKESLDNAIGAWQTFTPVRSGVPIGNAVYRRVGSSIEVQLTIDTDKSQGNGDYKFKLPASSAQDSVEVSEALEHIEKLIRERGGI